MSDQSAWGQKVLQETLGIRVAVPAAQGPQEATVMRVGTEYLSVNGAPAVSMPCVWFSLPNTFGDEPGFGPAAYQPVPGWTPTIGTPCIVVFAGNGIGRPYVVGFPTAVLASTPSIDHVVNVIAYGAKGDGVTDDTAAIQAALNTGESVYVPYTSAGYLVDGTLSPMSYQRIQCDGFFIAGANVVMWDFNGVLETEFVGTLRIVDPSAFTTSSPTIRFRGMCRWLAFDRIRVNNAALPIEMIDINESHFGELHLTSVRTTGITVTDGGATCNVHDNTVGSIFVGGVAGSANGLLFNSALNGTIGGNNWGDVSILSMGGDGLLVTNSGFSEQWFGNVIADSCGGDGAHLYGGTFRFFFEQLWCSTNGSNGFYCDGASSTANVTDIQIGSFYAHNNSGSAGFFLDGWCENFQVGKLDSNNHPGGFGVLFDKTTTALQIGSLATYGNGTGVSDNNDATSSNIQIALANVTDGTNLTHATPLAVLSLQT